MILLQDNLHALRLYSFDTYLCTKDGSKIRNIPDKLSVDVIFFDCLDKAAINLDDIDRYFLENTNGRKARTEVIKRDKDTPGSQFDDNVLQEFQIQQPAALRYLQAKMLRRVG